MFALRVDSISKSFASTRALDNVNLEVAAGEVHAVVGENGAGKSTLFNILSGAYAPDGGRMELHGKPFAPHGSGEARARGIAMVHQELALFPHLTVAENIFVGNEPSKFGLFDRKHAEGATSWLLQSLGIAGFDWKAKVGELSIAQRQLVEICRAVAFGAKVVLMDEPTSSLERGDIKKLFALVRSLVDDGITIIYVSHFLEEVREIASSFTVLRDGTTVGTGQVSSVTDERLVEMIVGRKVDKLFPCLPKFSVEATPLLEVRKLSAPPGLRSSSFTLRCGEVFGIAGLMGSGRTDLVKAIFGLQESTDGTIEVLGRKETCRFATPWDRIRQGIGYLSEDRKGEGLALPLSIADNITLSSFAAVRSFTGWLDIKEQCGASTRWAKRLNIRSRSCRQPVAELSGGNQQKVALSRILHQGAAILLLDEPTRGIDIGSKAVIYRAIAEFVASGKAVLLVSSYLPELFGMCHTLAVMNRGVLSPAKPIKEWTAESVMQAAIVGAREG